MAAKSGWTIWSSLIVGEISHLVTVMRRNRKWKTSDLDFQAQRSTPDIIACFNNLRRDVTLAAASAVGSVDLVAVVAPFVDVIRSTETSGLITGLALGALEKFVVSGMFDSGSVDACHAIADIADAVAHCRFESTDTRKDEAVLMKILQLQVALLQAPAGTLLTDEAVWEMLKTCFRVHRQMRPPDYSELLCTAAENTLLKLAQLIFARLPEAVEADRKVRSGSAPIVTSLGYRGYGLPVMLRVFEFLCTLADSTNASSAQARQAFEFLLQTQHGMGNSGQQDQNADGLSLSREGSNSDLASSSSESVYRSLSASPGASQQQGGPGSVLSTMTATNTTNGAGATTSTGQQQQQQPGSPSPPTQQSPQSQQLQHPTSFSSFASSSQHDPQSPGRATYPLHGSMSMPRLSVSMLNQTNSQNQNSAASTTRTTLAAQLLLTSLESGGHAFAQVEPLVWLVQDRMFKFLLRCCRTTHAVLVSIALRTIYTALVKTLTEITLTSVSQAIMRERLAVQLELVMNTVYLRILTPKNLDKQDSSGNNTGSTSNSNSTTGSSEGLGPVSAQQTYELKELVLESLLDLCRLPWFFSELFVNYDCKPEATNVFANLFNTLCKCVFPTQGLLTNNHVLALRCLLEGLECFRRRSEVELSLESPSQPRPAPKTRTFANATASIILGLNGSNTTAENNSGAENNADEQLLRDLRTKRRFKRLIAECVEEFNKKPAKGITKLAETFGLFSTFARLKDLKKNDKISEEESQQVDQLAQFLRFTPGIEKVALGEFLAQPSHFAMHVREAFCTRFDFRQQALDDSLRTYLEAFRLPLEAQQIDRMIASFANRWHAHNPSLLANPDAAHTLSFSLIMLNTDQHNPLIKNRMTLPQFINNNRGINGGQNVPPALLESLYYSIKENEIKMSGEGMSSSGAIGDALWTDMLRTHPHLRQPYLKCSDGTQRFVQVQPAAPSYATPYSTTSLFRSVQLVAPQWTLRSSVELKSSAGTKQGVNNNATGTGTTGNSTSSVSSPSASAFSDLGSKSIVIACDEEMYSEVWEPAMAALNIVFDMCPVDPLMDSNNSNSENGSPALQPLNISTSPSSQHHHQHHQHHQQQTLEDKRASPNLLNRPRRNSIEQSPRGLQTGRRGRASSRAAQLVERKHEILDAKLDLLKEPSPLLKPKPGQGDLVLPHMDMPSSAGAGQPRSPTLRHVPIQQSQSQSQIPSIGHPPLHPQTHTHTSHSSHPHSHNLTLSITTNPVEPHADEHDDSVVSLVREGFELLTQIAAHFHQLHMVLLHESQLQAQQQQQQQSTTQVQLQSAEQARKVAHDAVSGSANIVDKIVFSLCKLSGLPLRTAAWRGRLAAAAQRDNAIKLFASQPKAQFATRVLFNIAHKFGDSIHEGWREILLCIMQLYFMGALPPSVCELDDFVDFVPNEKGRRLLLSYAPPRKTPPPPASALGSLFSTVTSFLLASGPTEDESQQVEESKSPELTALERQAKFCAGRCNIGNLFGRSDRLSTETLVDLLSALSDLINIRSIASLNWPQRPHTKHIHSSEDQNHSKPVTVKSNHKRSSDGKLEQEPQQQKLQQQQQQQDEGNSGSDVNIEDFEFQDEYQHDGEDSSFDGTSEGSSSSGNSGSNSTTGSTSASAAAGEKKNPGLHSHHLEIPPLIRQLLLSLQLMTRVLLQNGHRLHMLWPRVKPLLCEILNMSKPSLSEGATPGTITPSESMGNLPENKLTSAALEAALQQRKQRQLRRPLPPICVEAALVSLLKIALRVVSATSEQEYQGKARKAQLDAVMREVIQTMQLLKQLDLRNDLLALQYSAGLNRLVQACIGRITVPSDWKDLLLLVARGAEFRYGFTASFQALSLMLMDDKKPCPCVSVETFPLCVQIILTFAHSRWCSIGVGMQCVDLLFALRAHLKGLLAHPSTATELVKIAAPVLVGMNSRQVSASAPATPSKSSTATATTGESKAAVGASTQASPMHHQQQQQSQTLDSSSNTTNNNISVTTQSNNTPTSAVALSMTAWQTLCRPLLMAFRYFCSGAVGKQLAGATPVKVQGGTSASNGPGMIRKQALQNLSQVLMTDDIGMGVANMVLTQFPISIVFNASSTDSNAASSSANNVAVVVNNANNSAMFPAALAVVQPANTTIIHPLAYSQWWQSCLDEVLFPLVRELGEAKEDGEDISRARMEAVKLLTKLFLRNLSQFIISARTFHYTWLQMLKTMDQYLQLGSSRGSHLTETVQEALKNMVLVLYSSNVFATNKELWDLTWPIVDPRLPTLREELLASTNAQQQQQQKSQSQSVPNSPSPSSTQAHTQQTPTQPQASTSVGATQPQAAAQTVPFSPTQSQPSNSSSVPAPVSVSSTLSPSPSPQQQQASSAAEAKSVGGTAVTQQQASQVVAASAQGSVSTPQQQQQTQPTPRLQQTPQQEAFMMLWQLVSQQQPHILKANPFVNYLRPEIDATGQPFIRVSIKDASQSKKLALPDVMLRYVRIVEEGTATATAQASPTKTVATTDAGVTLQV